MTLPKTIIFDLGKVLVDFDYTIAARQIAERSNLQVDIVTFFTEQTPLLLRYELGQVTTQQFFDATRAACGYRGTLDEFSLSFSDIFTPIEPMLKLHAALREKRFPCYIFSNTNELATRHISRRFPFFSNFDGYILSYEHGAMKPDAKLYEVVEQVTERRGQEVIYFDDRPENVAAGAERGWQAVLHESPDKTEAALNRAGLL